jgi:hypothetical protein
MAAEFVRVAIALMTYVISAAGLARLSVSLNGGYGSGGLVPFDLWSRLSVIPFALVAFFFSITGSERSAARTALHAMMWGTAFSLAWTLSVGIILGPWFRVSLPLLLSWAGSAASALAIVGGLASHRARFALLAAVPVACLGAFMVAEAVTRPLDDLLVYFGPDVTRPQVEQVWNNVPGAAAHTRHAVIRLGVADYNGRLAIRLAFGSGTRAEERAAVREQVRRMPYVAGVADKAPLPGSVAKREGTLPATLGYDAVVRPPKRQGDRPNKRMHPTAADR